MRVGLKPNEKLFFYVGFILIHVEVCSSSGMSTCADEHTPMHQCLQEQLKIRRQALENAAAAIRAARAACSPPRPAAGINVHDSVQDTEEVRATAAMHRGTGWLLPGLAVNMEQDDMFRLETALRWLPAETIPVSQTPLDTKKYDELLRIANDSVKGTMGALQRAQNVLNSA